MIYATISNIKLHPPVGKMRVGRLVMTLQDSKNKRFEAVYFAKSMRYLGWLKSKYKLDMQLLVIGKPSKSYNNYSAISFSHPEIITQKGENKSDFIKTHLRPRTVYGATSRLKSAKIHEMIMCILPRVASELSNILVGGDIKLLKALDNTNQMSSNPLLTLKNAKLQALYQIHNPQNMQEYQQAREYLCFEEAFLLQTMLGLRKAENENSQAIPRPFIYGSDSLANRFISELPWPLTNAQKSAFETISKELNSQAPMQRLLQGDVGSGKTVVAVLSMLQVIDNGSQAALLVPTEVLANQHFNSITHLLSRLYAVTLHKQNKRQVRVELLTSKTKAAVKRRILSELFSGEVDIIIGTHSLLHDATQFHDLGIVVIDEQHRFGAMQRNSLRENRTNTPHLLYMSATPIPRSVAMTYFADLNISTIDKLPAGRGKVETYIVRDTDTKCKERMWQRIFKEIDKGRNIFIVVPRIDDNDISDIDAINTAIFTKSAKKPEDDDIEILEISAILFEKMISNGLEEQLDAKSRSIASMSAEIMQNPLFEGVNIGIMHGRLSPTEKQSVMREFEEYKTQILLSTTVIEVGIDIPNASVMLICDADRFGLATLHQLRGRIGRSNIDGLCFLLESETGATENGNKRLDIIANSTDGFEIANADLDIRGIGDIISSRQSGRKNSLRLVNVLDDMKLINIAARLSKDVLKCDPALVGHEGLRKAIKVAYSDTEGDYIMRA